MKIVGAIVAAMLLLPAAKDVQGPVALQPARNVGKGVSAFPRVQANAAVPAAIAARINASLAKLDRNAEQAAQTCAEFFREQNGKPSGDNPWERTVTVTMKGPSYLSMEASDQYYCGGAHPDGDFLPMVYDLKTGRPVDWTKLLPNDVEADTASGEDGTTVGVVSWKPLHDRAVRQASGECKDVFDDATPTRFVLSLDGRHGTLVATPYDLPHVVAACAEGIELTPEAARKLGVSSVLTDALVAAKKLQ